jgi:hypothetical protein
MSAAEFLDRLRTPAVLVVLRRVACPIPRPRALTAKLFSEWLRTAI